MRWRGTAALTVGFALAFVGCTHEESDEGPMARAEYERRIRNTANVTITQVSEEEWAALNAKTAAAMTDEVAASLTNTYGRLGFFPMTTDLRATRSSANTNAYVAFYSSETKRIVVRGNVSYPILVHECVHALQDQRFDLTKFHAAETTDEALARTAVIEGDAQLIEARVALPMYQVPPTLENLARAAELIQTESEKVLTSGTPPIFVATPSFAYGHGMAFAVENFLRTGSEDVPFTTPPRTTLDILQRTSTPALRYDLGFDGLPNGSLRS